MSIKSDEKDGLYKIAKISTGLTAAAASFLTSIPGLSVLATELFSLAIMPPVEKRRIEFLNRIAEDLQDLKYNFQNLSQNEIFVTALLQGIQIAIRNHQQQKLDALRNAIINTAKPLFADDNFTLMFLNWIDIFTPWHLRLLEEINKGDIIFGTLENPRQEIINDSLLEQITSGFPESEFDPDLVRQALEDLRSRGLVKVDLVSQTQYGEFPSKVRLVVLGKKFLEFVTNNDISQ
jgi:hypothetical protein